MISKKGHTTMPNNLPSDAILLEKGHYTLPLFGGYLDIMISSDPDYPGIDIEFINNVNNGEPKASRPRVLIEQPSDTDYADETNYHDIRALIWDDPDSEDYTTSVTLVNGKDLKE